MQTIVYAVYAKLNSILDFTDNINQIELLTQKRWLKLNPHHTFELRRIKEWVCNTCRLDYICCSCRKVSIACKS